MSPTYDSSGDKTDLFTCKHMTESKDEDGKELEKKKEEQDQSKPPPDKLDLKTEPLAILLLSPKLA